MEFDQLTTAAAFVIVIGIATIGLVMSPVGMTTETILMMVLPSMIVFGLVMLFVGIKHGEYRAS